ncbi:galactose-1-phosphate uridylyltransferase, partial [Deinobacterium chartae]
YVKPDGRQLWLYARHPLHVTDIPSPSPEPVTAHPHLRWHPLRGEWVIYAAHRQNRTFLPPPEYNPLAPTTDPSNPTELPAGNYQVAVFENRFPSLVPHPAAPPHLPAARTAPGQGACEVVVFTQDATGSLGRLDEDHLELLLQVWADRTDQLGTHEHIRYVLPFENRGVEVGVTLHHPHGQIYAYPFIPPVQQKALELQRAHLEATGRNLGHDLVTAELEGRERLVSEREHALSFVPPFARYPYETWVMPKRPVAYLSELSAAQRRDLASSLKESVLRLDGLWGRPMPYLLTVQQAPTDGEAHAEWALRIELSPALRTESKLKFLAGTELGAGVFANDTLPEHKARELREVKV